MAAPEQREIVTADVMRLVEGTPFAHVRHTRDTGSTNEDALAAMNKPDSGGLTIVAEHQRSGSGRKGRKWLDAPRACLLFTTILPEPIPSEALWAVPFWVALCVRIAVSKRFNRALELQWPNDILLNGKKAGGILCASRVRGAEAQVACGIGLNVFRPSDKKLYAAIDPAPAFLSDEIPDVKREPLLGEILRTFAGQLPVLHNPRMVGMRWEVAAALGGTPYTVALDSGETLAGTAVRLDPDGALVVRVGEDERPVHLADARVVRA